MRSQSQFQGLPYKRSLPTRSSLSRCHLRRDKESKHQRRSALMSGEPRPLPAALYRPAAPDAPQKTSIAIASRVASGFLATCGGSSSHSIRKQTAQIRSRQICLNEATASSALFGSGLPKPILNCQSEIFRCPGCASRSPGRQYRRELCLLAANTPILIPNQILPASAMLLILRQVSWYNTGLAFSWTLQMHSRITESTISRYVLIKSCTVQAIH